jgi:putative hydrolase of the HAD superfamily
MGLMIPRALFFDMDDTLLDGITAMQTAWGIVCAEAAADLDCDAGTLREAIRRESAEFWKDESAVEKEWRTRLLEARELCVGRALAAEGLDTAPAATIARRYSEEHRAHLALFPDAIETLEAVKGSGLRLGLLTNGPAYLQRDKIARFGLEPYMDVIVIEGEFGQGKPHPRVFAHALASVGADAAHAWHVGDNLYADVGGAKAAGIYGVWIHRGRMEIREDAPAVPDRVIAHLAELREPLGI